MTIRLAQMQPEEIVRRTEIVGLEAFQDAAAAGKGAVMISGHLGNWEVAAASVAAKLIDFFLREPLAPFCLLPVFFMFWQESSCG